MFLKTNNVEYKVVDTTCSVLESDMLPNFFATLDSLSQNSADFRNLVNELGKGKAGKNIRQLRKFIPNTKQVRSVRKALNHIATKRDMCHQSYSSSNPWDNFSSSNTSGPNSDNNNNSSSQYAGDTYDTVTESPPPQSSSYLDYDFRPGLFRA